MNYKTLDSYSMLISSKYFESSQDFINLICVNSKFRETTEKLRFNPISITSLKLFPNIQTQYLYSRSCLKIEGIVKYEIWYTVTYDEYLKYKENNIKYNNVMYIYDNALTYGNSIPNEITIMDNYCFASNYLSVQSINLPSKLTKLGDGCFWNCTSLTLINLPFTLRQLGKECFYNCISLQSINLPYSLTSLSDGCFENHISLTSIALTNTLTSLPYRCFCFCTSLQSIDIPISITRLFDWCFCDCSNLEFINGPNKVKLGWNCFDGCCKLKKKPSHNYCVIC
ncbi:Leucine rich repeat protein bspa family [Entamoeba marina]